MSSGNQEAVEGQRGAGLQTRVLTSSTKPPRRSQRHLATSHFTQVNQASGWCTSGTHCEESGPGSMRGIRLARRSGQTRATTHPLSELRCCELVEMVIDYREKALAAKVRPFEGHLKRCDGCSADLSQMRETARLVGLSVSAGV